MTNFCHWCQNHGFSIPFTFQHRQACRYFQCRCFSCAGTGEMLRAAAKRREFDRKQNAEKAKQMAAKKKHEQKIPANQNKSGKKKNNAHKNVAQTQSSLPPSQKNPYCRFCLNHGYSYFNIGQHYNCCKYRECDCKKCSDFRGPVKSKMMNQIKDVTNKRSSSKGGSSEGGPSKRPRIEESGKEWPDCPNCLHHGFHFPSKPHHINFCLHKNCSCDLCRKERKSEKGKVSKVVESENNVAVEIKLTESALPDEVKKPCAVVVPKLRQESSTLATEHSKEIKTTVEVISSNCETLLEENEGLASLDTLEAQGENIVAPQTERQEKESGAEDASEDKSENPEESEPQSSQGTCSSSLYSETIGAPEILDEDDEYQTVSEASQSSNDSVSFKKLASKHGSQSILETEASTETNGGPPDNLCKSVETMMLSSEKSVEEVPEVINQSNVGSETISPNDALEADLKDKTGDNTQLSDCVSSLAEDCGSQLIPTKEKILNNTVTTAPEVSSCSIVNSETDSTKNKDCETRQNKETAQEEALLDEEVPLTISSQRKLSDIDDLMTQLVSLQKNWQDVLPHNRAISSPRSLSVDCSLFAKDRINKKSVGTSTHFRKSLSDSCQPTAQDSLCLPEKSAEGSPYDGTNNLLSNCVEVATENATDTSQKETPNSPLAEKISNDSNSPSAEYLIKDAPGNHEGKIAENVNIPLARTSPKIAENTSILPLENTGEHLCEKCNKIFSGPLNFSLHQYLKHNVDSESIPETKYNCRVCSYQSESEIATLDHEGSHMSLVPLNRMLQLFCAMNDVLQETSSVCK